MKKPVRTARVTFIYGALAAGLAVFLFAGHEPMFWAQWGGAILLGVGLMWTTVQIQSVALKLVVAAVALVETAVFAWLLQLGGIHWTPYATLAAGALATGFGLAHALSKVGRRRRMIEELLGGCISCVTFQKMLEAATPLPVDGEKREASVVECGIANQKELADKLFASDLVALSNAFAEVSSQALMDAGGVLAGSAAQQTRALFGAVLAEPEHAAQAREAARVLEEQFHEFRKNCQVRWGVVPDCRVTVRSGAMIVGIFGGVFDVVLAGE